MDEIRTQILNSIFKNGKLNHFCLRKDWFLKNNISWIYDEIHTLTNFLDKYDTPLRERIFYIENNLTDVCKCPYLKVNKLKFLKNKVRFSNYCDNPKCKSKHTSNKSKLTWDSMCNQTKIKRSKKISKFMSTPLNERFDEETVKSIKSKMSKKAKGRIQSNEEKIKRVNTRRLNGKEWHSKESIQKISKSNKITHSSVEFKEKHKETYKKAAAKISKTMKEKIKNGDFTPCITNSWTRWSSFIQLNDEIYKFRSNWDAVFWLLNQHMEYEKMRIPYVDNREEHIYIVDFVDYNKNEIFEIKPISEENKRLNKIKEKFAKQWCIENNFTYKKITDKWFYENIHRVDFEKHPYLKDSMKQFIND